MISNVDLDRRSILLTGTTFAIASVLTGGTTSVASAETSSLNPQPLPPSPELARAFPQGPDARVKITEEYARHVARDAYFWAWPMMNIYNRRLAFKDATEIMMSGPVPIAPLNHLGMLTDYIDPSERLVACPNQDVVYGAGSVASGLSSDRRGYCDRRRRHRRPWRHRAPGRRGAAAHRRRRARWRCRC